MKILRRKNLLSVGKLGLGRTRIGNCKPTETTDRETGTPTQDWKTSKRAKPEVKSVYLHKGPPERTSIMQVRTKATQEEDKKAFWTSRRKKSSAKNGVWDLGICSAREV